MQSADLLMRPLVGRTCQLALHTAVQVVPLLLLSSARTGSGAVLRYYHQFGMPALGPDAREGAAVHACGTRQPQPFASLPTTEELYRVLAGLLFCVGSAGASVSLHPGQLTTEQALAGWLGIHTHIYIYAVYCMHW